MARLNSHRKPLSSVQSLRADQGYTLLREETVR